MCTASKIVYACNPSWQVLHNCRRAGSCAWLKMQVVWECILNIRDMCQTADQSGPKKMTGLCMYLMSFAHLHILSSQLVQSLVLDGYVWCQLLMSPERGYVNSCWAYLSVTLTLSCKCSLTPWQHLQPKVYVSIVKLQGRHQMAWCVMSSYCACNGLQITVEWRDKDFHVLMTSVQW